jgi:hypothetical protein
MASTAVRDSSLSELRVCCSDWVASPLSILTYDRAFASVTPSIRRSMSLDWSTGSASMRATACLIPGGIARNLVNGTVKPLWSVIS